MHQRKSYYFFKFDYTQTWEPSWFIFGRHEVCKTFFRVIPSGCQHVAPPTGDQAEETAVFSINVKLSTKAKNHSGSYLTLYLRLHIKSTFLFPFKIISRLYCFCATIKGGQQTCRLLWSLQFCTWCSIAGVTHAAIIFNIVFLCRFCRWGPPKPSMSAQKCRRSHSVGFPLHQAYIPRCNIEPE